MLRFVVVTLLYLYHHYHLWVVVTGLSLGSGRSGLSGRTGLSLGSGRSGLSGCTGLSLRSGRSSLSGRTSRAGRARIARRTRGAGRTNTGGTSRASRARVARGAGRTCGTSRAGRTRGASRAYWLYHINDILPIYLKPPFRLNRSGLIVYYDIGRILPFFEENQSRVRG
jgi:hypothetical protein